MLLMTMAVMTALNIGIVFQTVGNQCCHRIIGFALNAAVKPDSCFRKGSLCAAANAAADQSIHLMVQKKACQRSVAAAHGIYHLFSYNLLIFNIIEFKLLCMAKMLKYISVFISYCNSHFPCSFLFPIT